MDVVLPDLSKDPLKELTRESPFPSQMNKFCVEEISCLTVSCCSYLILFASRILNISTGLMHRKQSLKSLEASGSHASSMQSFGSPEMNHWHPLTTLKWYTDTPMTVARRQDLDRFGFNIRNNFWNTYLVGPLEPALPIPSPRDL